MTTRKDLLRGARIDPMPVTGRESVADLVDNAFLAYNAVRRCPDNLAVYSLYVARATTTLTLRRGVVPALAMPIAGI